MVLQPDARRAGEARAERPIALRAHDGGFYSPRNAGHGDRLHKQRSLAANARHLRVGVQTGSGQHRCGRRSARGRGSADARQEGKNLTGSERERRETPHRSRPQTCLRAIRFGVLIRLALTHPGTICVLGRIGNHTSRPRAFRLAWPSLEPGSSLRAQPQDNPPPTRRSLR